MKTIVHLILSLFIVQVVAQTATDYSTLYNRIYTANFSSASSYNLSNLKTDGTFLNVTTYTTTQPTANTGAPREHLSEMLKIAKAYQTTGTNYHNADYLQAYVKAWNWWRTYDPTDTNWWWRSIGWPKSLYPSFVLIGRELKAQYPTDYANMVTYFKRDWTTTKINTYTNAPTGANTTDVCKYMFAVGVVDENTTIINQVATIMKNALSVVTGVDAEGVQPDYGFAQHNGSGRQIYLANYGKEFIDGLLDYLVFTAGTYFQVPDNKIAVLENLFLTNLSWTTFRNIIDQNMYGRFPEANYESTLRAQLYTLLSINTPQKAELQKLYNWMSRNVLNNATNVQVGNKMFWRFDYMVHKGTNYMVSTRMTSTRTVGCESGNGSGLSNFYTGSGVNYLYVTGGERYDIVANQNWRRLPGVTAPQKSISTALPLVNMGDNGSNLNAFAGGVSDGKTGASGFIFEKSQTEIKLKAYKSYFYFPDYYVLLGAGITAGANYNVPFATTVNQVKYNNSFTIDNNGTDLTVSAARTVQPLTSNWALLNGVGYHFIKNTGLNYQTSTIGTKTVAWIGVNHGNLPSNEQYAYAVYPQTILPLLKSKVASPSFEILANTASSQAVYDKNSYTVQAVFYTAGIVNLPNNQGSCQVDKPAVVQVKWTADSVYVTAANPYCETTPITSLKVTLTGLLCSNSTDGNNTSIVNFNMPQNAYQGQSITKGILKITTGIASVNLPALSFFPNPVKSGEPFIFSIPETIDPKQHIVIYDVTGKSVIQLQPTLNSNNLKLNTEQLKPGVYVVSYKNRIGKLIIH